MADVSYLGSHISQFHKINADGTTGPDWGASFGKNFNGQNCWAATGAQAADFATRGAWKPTPPEFRTESGDKSGGANRGDVARVLTAHGITAITPQGVTWEDVKNKLARGWGVWIATVYGDIPDNKSCQPDFDGLHALWLPPVPVDPDGKMVADDPLCDKTKKYPEEMIRKAAAHARNQAAATGFLVVFVKQKPAPKPPTPPAPVPVPVDPRDTKIAELTTAASDLEDQIDALKEKIAAAVIDLS